MDSRQQLLDSRLYLSSGELAPLLDIPGRPHEHEGNLTAEALLVATDRLHHRLHGGSLELDWQSPGAKQLSDLPTQLLLIGEAQRTQQPEPDGFPMTVATVARGRLDRVSDGVAEVEHLAPAPVALIGAHDGELGSSAGEDRLLLDLSPLCHRLPQRSPGDQGRLEHLHPSGRELSRGQRLEGVRIDDHTGGLVVNTHIVL